MKPKPTIHCSALTLLEVMVVLALLVMIVLMLLPMLATSRPNPWASCLNNLRYVGAAFGQWAADHNDRFPMALSIADGGTMDHPLAWEAWVHFQTLSNELRHTAELVCPGDADVEEALGFSRGFGGTNVSYFVSLDAGRDLPAMILAGDRGLTTNGALVVSGLHTINPSAPHGWSRGIHNRKGNIAFADGSVRSFSSAKLQRHIQANPQTNRLAIP